MFRANTARLFMQPAAMRANAMRSSAAMASASSMLMMGNMNSMLATSRRYNSASFTTDSDRADLNSRIKKNGEEGPTSSTSRSSASSSSNAGAAGAQPESDDYASEGTHTEKDADGNVKYYNPWEVLGLKPGASPHDIRLRYHELLQECHPEYVKGGKEADVIRLNKINKAYEIITKSPTLDKRYRNLVSDTQRMYYKLLPEWIARNVDEQPRYISWVRWRVPSPVQIVFLLIGLYATGRFYTYFPVFTIVFYTCVTFDFLFHTMSAPFALSMLFLSAVVSNQTYTMSWLVSPRGMLQGGLGY